MSTIIEINAIISFRRDIMNKIKKVFLIFISVILIGSFVGCGDSKESKENDLKANIITLTQDAVKEKLKAPSTAKFPASFEEYQIKEVASGDDNIKEYAVSSYVDAENEQGAKLRNRLVVKLQLTNDMKSYKILDVKIMEN